MEVLSNQLLAIWFHFVKKVFFLQKHLQKISKNFDNILTVPYGEFFVDQIRIVAQFLSESS